MPLGSAAKARRWPGQLSVAVSLRLHTPVPLTPPLSSPSVLSQSQAFEPQVGFSRSVNDALVSRHACTALQRLAPAVTDLCAQHPQDTAIDQPIILCCCIHGLQACCRAVVCLAKSLLWALAHALAHCQVELREEQSRSTCCWPEAWADVWASCGTGMHRSCTRHTRRCWAAS